MVTVPQARHEHGVARHGGARPAVPCLIAPTCLCAGTTTALRRLGACRATEHGGTVGHGGARRRGATAVVAATGGGRVSTSRRVVLLLSAGAATCHAPTTVNAGEGEAEGVARRKGGAGEAIAEGGEGAGNAEGEARLLAVQRKGEGAGAKAWAGRSAAQRERLRREKERGGPVPRPCRPPLSGRARADTTGQFRGPGTTCLSFRTMAVGPDHFSAGPGSARRAWAKWSSVVGSLVGSDCRPISLAAQ
jgi:hypothetical protein